MSNVAVFIKTHLWSESLELFIEKTYQDVREHDIDFFLLVQEEHDIDFFLLVQDSVLEDSMYKQFINNPNKIINNDIIKIYTEDNIREMYPNGVINMWISNHIIELWFYKNFGTEYDYIWSIEYDVRILGSGECFWKTALTHDLLIPKKITKVHKSDVWYNKIHDSFKPNERYHADLQMHRSSKRFLNKLDELFKRSINGQDEIIYGSVCMKYNFSYDYSLLNEKIRGTWSPYSKYSNYNTEVINSFNKNQITDTYIFHPVKHIQIIDNNNNNKNKNTILIFFYWYKIPY